jgi:hypothetical protein
MAVLLICGAGVECSFVIVIVIVIVIASHSPIPPFSHSPIHPLTSSPSHLCGYPIPSRRFKESLTGREAASWEESAKIE